MEDLARLNESLPERLLLMQMTLVARGKLRREMQQNTKKKRKRKRKRRGVDIAEELRMRLVYS
jgi:hypothetical protein